MTWLAPEDRSVVVFKVWPSLPYPKRLVVSFALILVGLVVQIATASFLTGLLPVVAGNLLLLVSGYDNRVDLGKFDPQAQWERIDSNKLEELAELDRKIRRWDLSTLDVTNVAGAIFFILVAAVLGFAAWWTRGLARILVIDAMVLLLPHWLTGIRSILVQPNLMVKVTTIRNLLRTAGHELKDHEVILMALLRGEAGRFPDDVKFKVDVRKHDEDFLGLYGQVVLNEVQGRSYPYFYVVLVARRGFGLRKAFERYRPPAKITKEFKPQDKVEVFVIRQHTTKTSGYHTKPPDVSRILSEGLRIAAQEAVKA